MKQHIAIIGIEQNKKQIAKKLADSLDMMLFDCNDYICFNNNMSVEQLIKKSNVTYFKKQVSKAICELEDLQNMVFCSCDNKLLSVEDLNRLGQYSYVIYLYDGKAVAQKDDTLARLCVQSQKRYRSRCDFALDIDGLSVDDAVFKICDYLKTI